MLLKWMGEQSSCVTWGVPHRKGEIQPGTSFVLSEGERIYPVQTRENAYWNDGSVKWTLHSVAELKKADTYELQVGHAEGKTRIAITETDSQIIIDTGAAVTTMNKSGTKLIDSIAVQGKLRCTGGRLVAQNENHFRTEGYETTATEILIGDTAECIVEESGEVRAIVRVHGNHTCQNHRSRNGKKRCFLPFDLRLYFYAGSTEIRIVHTFLFDGQQNTDFIRALGIEFDIALSGALYNRYVRFAGECGMYTDSPKGLLTWRTTGKYHDMYKQQNECIPLLFDSQEDEMFLGLLDESAVWNDFKLTQLSSEEYKIQKRTQEGCVYISGHAGRRSIGGGYIGDADGGLGVHMEKFWQKYPSSIECTNMAYDMARLKVWFWSPDAQPMDLRHYDTRTHVQSGYEGFDELRATPYGIANTNEITIKLYNRNPSNRETLQWIQHKNEAILLIPVDLAVYQRAGVLGAWSLENREGRQKALEEQNDALLALYQRERETRRWYGFWDYGDVMHTYDDVHHCWKYDMGGQAWQNTELVPNLWFWYGFLRSGRKDFFDFAYDMTRHTSEVDMYHIGEYAPLGSRHNVVHWGCGCKEARISMAHLHKICYYLTGDERIGDILDESVDVDYAVGRLDPMRAYYAPSTQFSAYVRFGPDVMAFCSNWFTYWERHRDEIYLNKLKKTLEFFKHGPRAVLSGIYGYDPQTTTYYDFKLEGGSHFMHCFGNFEVWLEIADCFEDEEMKERMADLGQFYGENESDRRFRLDKCCEWGFHEVPNQELFGHQSYDVGIGAFASARRGDAVLAEEIWDTMYHDQWAPIHFTERMVDSDSCHKNLIEAPQISTNGAAQWATNFFVATYFLEDK